MEATTLTELPIVAWVLGLSVVVGAVTVIVRQLLLPIHRGFLKLQDFLEEWKGEPARPGYAARPGVMQRLEQVEADMARVASEIRSNGGSSMKDAIARVETHLEELAARDEVIKQELAEKYAESLTDRELLRQRIAQHEAIMAQGRLDALDKLDRLVARLEEE